MGEFPDKYKPIAFVFFCVPPQAAFRVPVRRRSPIGRWGRADAGETKSQAGRRRVPAGSATPILRRTGVRGRASAQQLCASVLKHKYLPYHAVITREAKRSGNGALFANPRSL